MNALMAKHKHVIIFGIIISTILASAKVGNVSAYSYYCRTEECHAAEDAYNAAMSEYKSTLANIDSLNGQIASLEAENRSLAASIERDRAIVESLKQQIAETEARITELKTALAKVIINGHLDKQSEDIIMAIASGRTLGDIAERQSRQDTIKEQIDLYSKEIEEAKKSLETQKTVAETKIVEQEEKQARIEANKQEIANRLAGLTIVADNAKATADRNEAIVQEAKRKAMEAQQSQSGVSVYINGYYDTYPYHYECPNGIDSRSVIGGYLCECVSYTGWKVQEAYGISIYSWGNALDWDESARRAGFRVDNEPEIGSVAVSHYGGWGHVMWVEDIDYNHNMIEITEYNYNYGTFSARKIPIYGPYGYSCNWYYAYGGECSSRYGGQPWNRGYNYVNDYLYFIHFK